MKLYFQINLICLLFFACSIGCKQNSAVEDPVTTAEHISGRETIAERRIALLRQLCLLDFPDDQVQMVVGFWPFSAADRSDLGAKLQLETDHVYLALGRKDDGTWKSPEQSTIDSIGAATVHLAQNAKSNSIVLLLENLDLDAEHASLDLSTYNERLGTHGSLLVQLTYKNGKWEISSGGGCYALNPEAE